MLLQCRALCAALLAVSMAACSQANLVSPGAVAAAPPSAQITTGSIERKNPDTENKVRNLTGADFTFAVPGSPTDVYVLVARGAMSCWLSPAGPLRRSHIFSADVDPPAKGGAALITLHEKDPSLPDQRGVRAFQVALTASPGGTQVAIATPKIAPEVGEAMKQDVQVWARGKPGCEVSTLLAPTPTSMVPQAPVRPNANAKAKP